MTENEKIIVELLDEYATALNEREVNAAKSKIKNELANMLLDKLISQGYKQDKAEAVVDFVTRDAAVDVDYSSTLGKFGSNTIIDKVSGLKLKELYKGYLIYDKYNDDIETIIINGIELKKQLEENGEYDYNGKKQLVEIFDSFLNITINSLSNQPAASSAYKTYIKFSGMKASELMEFFIEHISCTDIAMLIAQNSNGLTLPASFQNILDGSNMWEHCPSLDDMENLYNGKYGYLSEEDLKLFEPYLQWRYMYEVEQELEAGGITLEEYTEMLEALNDKPSLFELVLNKWNDFWQGKGEELFEVIGKKHFESSNLKILNILQQVKKTFNIAYTTKYDPLILDLDGDGYNVETKENGANFDLDKNGFAEKINWTKKDGFLCLDLNGNGTIDNGGELFGDKTLLADGTTAKNGFEALAQYDGNGDGIIDENEIILKFIINKQLSVGKFSLYSFALPKSAWLNDRLCYN